MSAGAIPAARTARVPRVVLAALALAAGAAALLQADGWRLAALWLVGAGLGFVLFRATFSFAGGFRALLAERRTVAFRAQLALIGACAVLMLPAIGAGVVLGQPVRGFVFPTGVALLLGAFLFGIGMQLGGGCGSGTLYSAGGSGGRMWITLMAFIGGATLAAWQGDVWLDWPELPPIALSALPGGTATALALTLLLLAALWRGALAAEAARHGAAMKVGGTALLWAAAGLALLSLATLVLAGRPWAITAAFPLWGSRLIELAGWDDPAFWPYWEDPTRTEALFRPLWLDRTGVMDVGLMLGAALAAGLAGRAVAGLRLTAGAWAASLLGGLLLGVGAVLASGCNISAFVGGIASGSLHGWVWIVPALLGNWVGVTLRPWFGLVPPAPRAMPSSGNAPA